MSLKLSGSIAGSMRAKTKEIGVAELTSIVEVGGSSRLELSMLYPRLLVAPGGVAWLDWSEVLVLDKNIIVEVALIGKVAWLDKS